MFFNNCQVSIAPIGWFSWSTLDFEGINIVHTFFIGEKKQIEEIFVSSNFETLWNIKKNIKSTMFFMRIIKFVIGYQ